MNFFGIIIVSLSNIFLTSTSFAQAPQSIEEVATQSIQQFIPVLQHEREHYGLTADDPVDSATTTLGEGYPYFKFSVPAIKALEKGNSTPSLQQVIVPSGAYIFPVRVNGKPVGIAFVEKNKKGELSVIRISSYSTFEQDLAEAKSKLENLHGTGDWKLVYDEPFATVGIAMNSDIISMQKNPLFAIEKNQINTVPQYVQHVLKVQKEREAHPLVTSGVPPVVGETQSQNREWYWVIGLLAAGGFGYYGIRRLLLNKK